MKISQLLESQSQEQLSEVDWGKAWDTTKKVAGGVKDAAVGVARGVGDVGAAVAGGATQAVGALAGGLKRGYAQGAYHSAPKAPDAPGFASPTTPVAGAQTNPAAVANQAEEPVANAPAAPGAEVPAAVANPPGAEVPAAPDAKPANAPETPQEVQKAKVGVGQINKIIPTLKTRDLTSIKKNVDAMIAKKQKAPAVDPNAAGAGAIGNVAKTIQANQPPETTSTGGSVQTTPTGRVNKASATNLNQPQTTPAAEVPAAPGAEIPTAVPGKTVKVKKGGGKKAAVAAAPEPTEAELTARAIKDRRAQGLVAGKINKGVPVVEFYSNFLGRMI